MTRALLIGKEPDTELGFCYVTEGSYEAVVIGSMTLGQLLYPGDERILEALAAGKQVLLYTPGLPQCPQSRSLSSSLAAARRQLKNWGIVFTDGGRRKLITAEEAKLLRSQGRTPAPGTVLTPLAKEIMEESI